VRRADEALTTDSLLSAQAFFSYSALDVYPRLSVRSWTGTLQVRNDQPFSERSDVALQECIPQSGAVLG